LKCDIYNCFSTVSNERMMTLESYNTGLSDEIVTCHQIYTWERARKVDSTRELELAEGRRRAREAREKAYQVLRCVCIYICIYMYICMYVCMYIYVYTYVYIYMYTHMYIYTCACTYMYMYTYVYIYAYA